MDKKSNAIWTFDFIKVFLITTALAFATQFQATTFPLYVQHLGGDLAIAGLMTSAYMGTSAIWKPIVGKIIGSHAKKRLFIIMGCVFACILFCYGYLSSILVIIMIRLVSSPFYSICSSSVTTIATDIIPNERLVEGIGYYNISSTISSALGATLALFIINKYGFKSLFGAASLCVLIAILICFTVKYKDKIVVKNDKNIKEVKEVRRYTFKEKINSLVKTSLFFPCLTLFFVLIGSSGTVTYLPTWGKAVGIANIGTFFTVQAITLAISRVLVGRINKKFGIIKTVSFGMICVVICMFGIRFCTSLFSVCILSLFLGFGSGIIMPTMHAYIVSLVKEEERGMANSLYQMSNDAGICVCSLLLGILAQNFGIENIFTFAAIFPVIALFIFFIKVTKQVKQDKNWN